MITCPFCQTTHVDNTLFCDECGTYLLEEDKRDTFPLEEEEEETHSAPPKTAELDLEEKILNSSETPFSANASKPLVLRLKIGPKKREVEVALDKAIHLGRLDPGANVYPEVDLTNDNGLENGISRKHVRLLSRKGEIFVEDLGSTNGTFINGKRIASYLPEPLLDGDVLMLGRLAIIVNLYQPPQ
ncbi:MAG: FHA domain-containing protein [Anaerolineae bacterium]